MGFNIMKYFYLRLHDAYFNFTKYFFIFITYEFLNFSGYINYLNLDFFNNTIFK